MAESENRKAIQPGAGEIQDTAVLTEAVRKDRYMHRIRTTVRSTFLSLVVVAAAVLAAVLLLPVLKIYGKSMSATLDSGDNVVSVKSAEMETGDIVAFYYNNNILVKRVIANSGDWMNLDEDGTVYVNNARLREPYLDEKSYGETNIELPYQVPEGKTFVLEDNRAVSIDSRNTFIGHLEQSSLPVGSESTHCLLSGNRGLPSARLFTDLDKLKEGDTFTLTILNETMTYEVDRIWIVEPDDLSHLEIEKGKDYCTLITCMPYGINTHRPSGQGAPHGKCERKRYGRGRCDPGPPCLHRAIYCNSNSGHPSSLYADQHKPG